MSIRRNFTVPNLTGKIEIEKNFRMYLANLMTSRNSSISVFANICAGLKIVENPSIPTMCVSISNGHYLLQYNPKMVEELDLFGTSIVLCHEMAHLSLGHTARMLRFFEAIEDKELLFKYKQVVHQAADYAVNSWLIDVLNIFTLQDLKTKIGKMTPSGMATYAGIHPSDVGLDPARSLEYYVFELASKIEDLDVGDLMNKLMESGMSGDEASDIITKALKSAGNQEGDYGNSEGGEGKEGSSSDKVGSGKLTCLKNIPKEVLEKLGKESNNLQNADQSMREDSVPEGRSAAEVSQDLQMEAGEKLGKAIEDRQRAKGDIGLGIRELFNTLYLPPSVRWQDILQRFCKSSRPSDKDRTIVKPKRKYADLGSGFRTSQFPGTKKNPKYNIAFAVDTSGSVSNDDIQLIMAELDSLAKDKNTVVTVIEADTKITKIYDLAETKAGDRNVCGRGGTDFNEVFQLVKEGSVKDTKFRIDYDVDLLIYATDGECYNPKVENRIPSRKVIWLSTTSKVPSDSYWGTAVTDGARYGEASYGRFILIGK
jgi:predicted metal-dependent peptidase